MTPTKSTIAPARLRDTSVARVDVWLKRVDHPVSDEHWLWLSDAEQTRAQRFNFERDRARFVNRRAFARRVLATYLDRQPEEVRIRAADYGRPKVDGGADLAFSTSHSDGIALVAVTHGRPVGVDLERIRPVADGLSLAEGLFHDREVEALAAMPDGQRSRGFLRLWTRKESIVKADGRGLAIPLDQIDVLSDDGQGTGQPRSSRGEVPFVFADLHGSDEWIGAIAVGGQDVSPRVSLKEAA